MRRTVAWLGVFVVAASALIFAAVDEGEPQTNADRAYGLAQDFACPVCQGQSVAESDVPVARTIRREIRVWVDEGRSDDFIRQQLVSFYGDDIDYTPSGSGITSLVWILPVVGGAAAVGGLTIAVRRWQVAAAGAPAELTDRAGPQPRRRTRARSGVDPVATRSWGRVAAWMAGVVVVATVAGVFVAQFSGSRRSGESISGDIRTTTRELLFDAGQAAAAGDTDEALGLYDEVLELQPTNSEALTYKAWLLRLSGDLQAASELIEEAVAVDPDYPDARVFGAVIALDQGDVQRAAAHLEVFDTLSAPPAMEGLVEAQGLRERVELAQYSEVLERVEATLMVDDPPPFAETGLTVEELLNAAELMAFEGRVFEAIQLVGGVEAESEPYPDLLAGYAWLLARSATPEQPDTAELALDRLDTALAIDAAHPESLVYRAFVHVFLGDQEAGAADLAAFDALSDRPADLLDLIDDFDLRGQLS